MVSLSHLKLLSLDRSNQAEWGCWSRVTSGLEEDARGVQGNKFQRHLGQIDHIFLSRHTSAAPSCQEQVGPIAKGEDLLVVPSIKVSSSYKSIGYQLTVLNFR